jgi:hypothetical protein
LATAIARSPAGWKGLNDPMMVPVPEPWALLLISLILLAILGVALYGMGPGFAGVVLGIEVRARPDRQPATVRRDARRYGRHALISGGVYLACYATISAGLKSDLDLRLLLIAEPALLLGVAAIVLARPTAGPGLRVLDLISLVAWAGQAVAAPIELSALQLDREMRRTIAETHERIAIADEIMDERYDQAVRAKVWSVHNDQTRRWARIGLQDARSGLRAAERLAAQAPDGPERRRLLGLRAEFAGQIERYEGFVRGLGENP